MAEENCCLNQVMRLVSNLQLYSVDWFCTRILQAPVGGSVIGDAMSYFKILFILTGAFISVLSVQSPAYATPVIGIGSMYDVHG